jgi:hypothetical protein
MPVGAVVIPNSTIDLIKSWINEGVKKELIPPTFDSNYPSTAIIINSYILMIYR